MAPHLDVIDAPVSGGPQEIAAGRVTLFVGGSDDAVTRVTPLLSAYGDPIFHVGPTGSGQKVKLINNAMFAAQIGLVKRGRRARRPAWPDRVDAARGASQRQRLQSGGRLRRGARFGRGFHRQRR